MGNSEHGNKQFRSSQERDERIKIALDLHSDLHKILDKSEEGNFMFLSYLLRMAILETQSVASSMEPTYDAANSTIVTSH